MCAAMLLACCGFAIKRETVIQLYPHRRKRDLHKLSAEEDFVVAVVVALHIVLVSVVEHLSDAPVAMQTVIVQNVIFHNF